MVFKIDDLVRVSCLHGETGRVVCTTETGIAVELDGAPGEDGAPPVWFTADELELDE